MSEGVIEFPVEDLRQSIFVVGPTAAGKTSIALELAERLAAEILALDSMTIYRGLDIGTAKPTAAEQKRVRHHLLDLKNPDEEFSVADYVQAASAACKEVLSRGKTPLFVGGTGLYLRSLLRGVCAATPADWNLRYELEALAAARGVQALYHELQQADPASAARLHPNDLRRVIRALEVYRTTGATLSQRQQQGARAKSDWPRAVLWLDWPRAHLHQRIDARVNAMLEAGLVDEVRALTATPRGLGRTAAQALGYKEVIAWLPQQTGGTAALAAEIQLRTRQFAKRQTTWFRNLVECTACSIPPDVDLSAIAAEMANVLIHRK